eukprot:525730-Pleurochrysis_carterae.AAC.3
MPCERCCVGGAVPPPVEDQFARARMCLCVCVTFFGSCGCCTSRAQLERKSSETLELRLAAAAELKRDWSRRVVWRVVWRFVPRSVLRARACILARWRVCPGTEVNRRHTLVPSRPRRAQVRA